MSEKRVAKKLRIYTDKDHWILGKNTLVTAAQWATGVNAIALSIAKNWVLSERKKSVASQFRTVDPASESEYALRLGHFVKKHAGDAKKSKRYSIDEILVDDKILREHMQIIGTTGSGKTVFLKSLLEQQIARGGGAFAVFGKADNKMLQQIFAVAAKHRREQDLFIVDWTATPEKWEVSRKRYGKKVISHTINLFEMGGELDIISAFLAIADIDDRDSWGKASKSFLQSLLQFLIRLDAAGLNPDTEKLDAVLESDDVFAAMKKYREKLNYYHLRDYLTDKKFIFSLLTIIERAYREAPEAMLEATAIGGDGIRLERRSGGRFELHDALKKTIKQQTTGIDIDKLLNDIAKKKSTSPIDAEEEKRAGKQSAFYKLEVSLSQTSNILTFYDRFEYVLKSRSSDIDLIEAIEQGRIVIMNVPGQDWENAPKIARFVISMLQLVIKKRGSSKAFDLTYLLILDEINSWMRSKEPLGLGNILSVIRGLGIGAIVAYQSSLEGLDENKGVELEQITANVNTTIVLKNTSSKIRDAINKIAGKREEAEEEEKIESSRSGGRREESRRVTIKEKEFFDEETLTKLASGEGYMIRNGEAGAMVTDYRGEDRYLADEEEPVDIVKMISIEELKRAIA